MLASHLHLNFCLYVFAGLCLPVDTVTLKWPAAYYIYMVSSDIFTILNFVTIGANFIAPNVPFPKRCYSGFTALATAQSIMKLAICYIHKNRYGDYFKLWDDLIQNDADDDLKKAMIENKKFVRRLSMGLFVFMVSPMIPWGSLPLFIKLLSYFIPSLENSYKFIAVPAQFPFDPMESPAYEVVTVFQGVAAVAVNGKLMAFDCLLYGLISFKLVYCSYLKNQFGRLINLIETDQERIKIQSNLDYKTEVKKWVKNHCKLLHLCRSLNELYSPVLLMQFFSNILILCSMGVFCVLASPTVTRLELLFSFGYVIGTIVQLFTLCWLGEEITTKSVILTDKGFWQAWYACPPEVQSSLKIIFEKSKVPIKVSAFGAFHLSVETFKSIVGTAFSYFMVLNQIKNNVKTH